MKLYEDAVKELQAIEAQLKQETAWLKMQQPLASASKDTEHAHRDTSFAQTIRSASSPASEEKNTMTPEPFNTPQSDVLQITAEVRILTDELSSSLSALSELLQVNRATASDSWRKIRGMEGGLSRLKAEIDNMQVSQERIIRWEESLLPKQSAIPGLAPQTPSTSSSNHSSSDPEAFSSGLSRNPGNQARKQFLAAQHLLDEATVRAQHLLAVQP